MKSSKILYLIFFFFLTIEIQGQISPPYYCDFNEETDAGWSHYSLEGKDDWQRGFLGDKTMFTSLIVNKVWATNLGGAYSAESKMYLETPAFDLSKSTEYVLSFTHLYYSVPLEGGNLEYSVDNGVSWLLLNGQVNEKKSWYGNNVILKLGQLGWDGNGTHEGLLIASHSLKFLQGNANVKFRFQFGSSSRNSTDEGWAIDNFKIQEIGANIIALEGERSYATNNFETFTSTFPILYEGLDYPNLNLTTGYYFSVDETLDSDDMLIGIENNQIIKTFTKLTASFNMIKDLPSGDYYIFAKNNPQQNITELSYGDNISKIVFHVDSVFTTPFRDDFESVNKDKSWNTYCWDGNPNSLPINYNYWDQGSNSLPKIYGTHSGKNAWFISEYPQSGGGMLAHYLETPYFKFTDKSPQVFCFWYKLSNDVKQAINIDIQLTNNPIFPYYKSLFSIIGNVKSGRFNDWDCKCVKIESSGGLYSKIRLDFESYAHNTNYAELMVVDDVYIGNPVPDLSIEHSHLRTLDSNLQTDTLFYTLFNSGLKSVPASFTKFYWSNDSLLDASDELLGTSIEPAMQDTSFKNRKFGFKLPKKPIGRYYIVTVVDSDKFIEEMWETNNVSAFPIVLESKEIAPYENTFEDNSDKWFSYNLFGNVHWQWGSVSEISIGNMPSGQNAFTAIENKTEPSKSLTLLYTPLFDLSKMDTPILEFDMVINHALLLVSNRLNANMSYSTDNGANWTVLDTLNQSFTSWYYPMKYDQSYGKDRYSGNATQDLFAPMEKTFATSHDYKSRDVTKMYKYIVDISSLNKFHRIQFRFNLITCNNGLKNEMAIDNFKIKEKYIDLLVKDQKKLYKSPYSKQLNFFMNIDNEGNYFSKSSSIAFYLSQDSLLDKNDLYINSEKIPSIKPKSRFYLNSMLNCSTKLSGFNYLLYKLDDQNLNIESNETNNIGNWPLLTEGITKFPYLQVFEDTIVHGWNNYVYAYTVYDKEGFRFRNMKVPNEAQYLSNNKSGQMFTDEVSVSWSDELWKPIWYLETPNFNFSKLNKIKLSFDLSLISYFSDGANLEYSTNGGLTWILLNDNSGLATNWYNSLMTEFNREYGWSRNNSPTFLNSSIDISFLAGYSSVLFRFKYKATSKFYDKMGLWQGMRLDNFKIESPVSTDVEELSVSDFEMYPNPVKEILHFSVKDLNSGYSIKISNLLGEVVFFQENINSNTYNLNCSQFKSGYYIVELCGNEICVKKLLIQ